MRNLTYRVKFFANIILLLDVYVCQYIIENLFV